jgi:hypothetical protein
MEMERQWSPEHCLWQCTGLMCQIAWGSLSPRSTETHDKSSAAVLKSSPIRCCSIGEALELQEGPKTPPTKHECPKWVEAKALCGRVNYPGYGYNGGNDRK